jgi:hypothetical protein
MCDSGSPLVCPKCKTKRVNYRLTNKLTSRSTTIEVIRFRSHHYFVTNYGKAVNVATRRTTSRRIVLSKKFRGCPQLSCVRKARDVRRISRTIRIILSDVGKFLASYIYFASACKPRIAHADSYNESQPPDNKRPGLSLTSGKVWQLLFYFHYFLADWELFKLTVIDQIDVFWFVE